MAKVFQEWLDELDAYTVSLGFKDGVVKQTGHECWFDFYMEGLSPEEAWKEDNFYADGEDAESHTETQR